MRKLFFVIVLLTSYLTFTAHKTDEGMFPLSELKNIDLVKAGLKLNPIDLYNPNGVSTIDAIVRVGGCTGSFISNDGLIITNHHCAFGYVQAISTTENNYINTGFLAKDKATEVLAKGLTCKITASYQDVSEQVLMGTQNITDPKLRLATINENIKKVTEEQNAQNKGLQCEISEMFTGKTYVVFRYKIIKDVRLVYVPARSIGEYGGERDNWVWPRHSGDFAFLRAYVAPDGSAADYAINNVPYKPAKYLKVNQNGVKENDFVFILGYPGRTFRNQPASFYKYHEEYMLKYVSDLFDWQINTLEGFGKNNTALEIKYASKIKSLANVTKNYKGKLQGFRRVGLTKQKFEEEQQMQNFINGSTQLKNKYADVIPQINKHYQEIIEFAPRNLWLDYVYNVSPILNFAAAIDNYGARYNSLKTDAEKQDFLKTQLPRLQSFYQRIFSSFDLLFEPNALYKMLNDAKTFNDKNQISAVTSLLKKFKTNEALKAYCNQIFNKSKITNGEHFKELFEANDGKIFKLNDPIIALAKSINIEANKFDEEDRIRDSELNLLLAKYADAKSEFKQKSFIPDANATLRFTYGYVRGYWPNDGEYNKPFTTLTGVIEKEDGQDYELLAVIKELYAAKDFGGLVHPDYGDLPINFLYNLDTTGGNSGSPILNANGELIGVNFDRAYTATINDYAWNEAYSRSVGVDIRYVLWVVKKVAKADYLINEMGVKVL